MYFEHGVRSSHSGNPTSPIYWGTSGTRESSFSLFHETSRARASAPPTHHKISGTWDSGSSHGSTHTSRIWHDTANSCIVALVAVVTRYLNVTKSITQHHFVFCLDKKNPDLLDFMHTFKMYISFVLASFVICLCSIYSCIFGIEIFVCWLIKISNNLWIKSTLDWTSLVLNNHQRSRYCWLIKNHGRNS